MNSQTNKSSLSNHSVRTTLPAYLSLKPITQNQLIQLVIKGVYYAVYRTLHSPKQVTITISA